MTDIHPAMAALTLEDKAALVSGADFWRTAAVGKAGIVAALLTDGPHGVRLQRDSADHLGINDSEPATAFPTGSALGSSWDPDLAYEIGVALGVESRALGVDILLGPGANMKRSPLCGRNFEYLSEDPHHAGILGAAWVEGVQSQGVGASLKHFAANNQETDRMRLSVTVDERTLREIYLPAFEHIVKVAKPATVMCSYNAINGAFSAESRWLLSEVLRDDWGFDGYVVSDWGAVQDPVASVAAGLDVEMPSTAGRSAEAIVAAVGRGDLDEVVLDTAISRQLRVHDGLRAQRTPVSLNRAAHHELARRAAAQSAVLLRNDPEILPLDPEIGGTIAVIGEFARTPRYQGAGSSHIVPTRLEKALDEIRAIVGDSRDVRFEPGFLLDGSDDAALRRAAVVAATDAEVVLLFLGLPDADESEGFDRDHIDLPDVQRALLAEILAVNTSVVAILSNGGIVRLDGPLGLVPGLLEMWLGGQASGGAAADLIFGRATPSGRLAETIPLALSDTPAHVNWPGSNSQVLYGERHYIGYRWYDSTARDVAYPLGYGLSYTTFSYSDLVAVVADSTVAEVDVSFTVTNAGQREAADVPQVYVRDLEAGVDRAVRELKGFRKVRLAAGESARVQLTLTERDFAFWGKTGWTVEPGEFIVEVGASSRDIRLSHHVWLDVPAPAYILDDRSTVAEWIRHPTGASLILDILAPLTGGAPGSPISEESMKMGGSIPLATFLGFAGISTDVLDDLLRTVNMPD